MFDLIRAIRGEDKCPWCVDRYTWEDWFIDHMPDWYFDLIMWLIDYTPDPGRWWHNKFHSGQKIWQNNSKD